jgi:LAO/AO transport system kinase
MSNGVTTSPPAGSAGNQSQDPPGLDGLAAGIVAGDRRALARGITLVESTRPDHRVDAAALLDELLPRTGKTIRIGISGAPGVGKSTFIERFGLHIAREDHRIAVLAVDPSSMRSGGSILGDKTRMEELGRDPRAFIRPSPSGGALGGVARRTREAMLVCEAAGFDVVAIETVGIGQSEVEVDDMVDVFVLLVSPGGGDELQGIKRGVTEVADVVVVTKADGELLGAAQQAAADYGHALHLLRPKHDATTPTVLLASALLDEGVAAVWDAVVVQRDALERSGELASRRDRQAVRWLWAEVTDTLLERFRAHPAIKDELAGCERAVAAGELSPLSAARRLLDLAR